MQELLKYYMIWPSQQEEDGQAKNHAFDKDSSMDSREGHMSIFCL